jgi:hypothetical protein
MNNIVIAPFDFRSLWSYYGAQEREVQRRQIERRSASVSGCTAFYRFDHSTNSSLSMYFTASIAAIRPELMA